MSKVISLSLFILALFFVYQGWFRYDFWNTNAPGSGFIPVIAGVLLAVFTMILFIKEGTHKSTLHKKHLYPIIGSFLFIMAIPIQGMIFSIAVFMIMWLIIIEKFMFSRASIYGISITVFIYLIFKVFLNVPLPKGFIGI